MRTVLTALTVASMVGGLVSCAEKSSGEKPVPETRVSQTTPQIFSVKGAVKELKPDGKTVVIKHEEIPNYMPAMTMPLEVKNTKELDRLQPGDQIEFRMLVMEKEAWIDRINRLGSTNRAGTPTRETFRRVRMVDPLNVGDAMPDYPFTNELGQAIHLGQFKGQSLGLTFIYTRCPLPTFCPRMSSNFADACRKLSMLPDAPKNWRLLSISFDPEHDTPPMLKGYAKRYDYDTNHWSFATGALIDIDAITEQFGLMFPREGAGVTFNHNLRTVVVDAQGRVQKVFIGNEWKVEDFVEEMVKAAGVKDR
ncbi:MAG: electron transporter SenC [Verrucomicrobia bacterium]|nr:MAG: electron transporter SenC [Verrucomicrobiota bacterium]